jgi:hypothetical protein
MAKTHEFMPITGDKGRKILAADNDEELEAILPTATSSYTLPDATDTTKGGVLRAKAPNLITTANATQAAGETPTAAEYNALANLANANKTAINAIINAWKTAKQAA